MTFTFTFKGYFPLSKMEVLRPVLENPVELELEPFQISNTGRQVPPSTGTARPRWISTVKSIE